jgi:hypothetical protein
MRSISSRTNSPAWVLGDLPARLSALAFLMVCFLGIGRYPLNVDDICSPSTPAAAERSQPSSRPGALSILAGS